MRAATAVRRAVLVAVLAVCGGCSASYTVGGVVSGLSGTGLVLQNNGGNNNCWNSRQSQRERKEERNVEDKKHAKS